MKKHLRHGARKGRTASGNLREQVIPYKCCPQPTPPQEAQSEGKMWPTPKALEVNESAEQWAKRRLKPSAKMMGPSLTVAVQLPTPPQGGQSSTPGSPQELPWATPYAGTKDHEAGSLESYQRRVRIGKQVSLHGQITIQANEYRGKLNPRWVETLMGLPVGWVMPSCATPWTIGQMNCDCSGTGSSPRPQSGPSEPCGPISGGEG